MADPVTGNIQLFVPTRGSNQGTWDVPLNENSSVLDACLGGIQPISLSNTNVTLSVSQAQNAMLLLTGTLSANVDVILPAIFKAYFIDNQTTGNFIVRIVPPGATQVVAVPQGSISQVMVSGTVARFLNLGKVGDYWDCAAAAVPSWVTACTVPPYLNCDGSTFSAITYPYLDTFLGGNTLPDLRGSSRAYLNQGTGRITTASSGIDGNTLLARGGVDAGAIAKANLPAVAPAFTGTAATITVNSTQGFARFFSPFTLQGGPNGVNAVFQGNFTVTSQGSYTPAGTIANLGSGTAFPVMGPTTISGITMIRAA